MIRTQAPVWSSGNENLMGQLPIVNEPASMLGGIETLPDADSGRPKHNGVQHIGFKLHTEEFLLPMQTVREIIMLPTVTYVPRSKTILEGIIALRGEIMPVLNIRRSLGFPRGNAGASTRVIILQSEYGGFGVIVDEITEFVWLESNEVESLAQNFFASEYRILSGVARVGERIRGIVDVKNLVEMLDILPEAAGE